MRERRAEQRHDAVAHHLVDGALVAVDGLHHAFEHRVEELPRLLGIAVGQQFHRALQVGKQHRDLFALAFQGTAGRQNLLGQIGGRVGQRGLGLHQHGSGVGVCNRHCVTRPDQDIAPLIHGEALALDEFILQIVQGRVVELKLPLEGAVGQASPALEHGDRLVENLLKGHRHPSRCRCGVQKTVWEWAKPCARMYTA